MLRHALFFSFLVLASVGFGQDQSKIETFKRDYITEKLQLTKAEADNFFPIYKEFMEKRKEIRKSLHRELKNTKNSNTDADSRESMTRIMAQEQSLLNLQKEYYEKFKKVIPERKIFQLIDIEKEFKKMLLNKLRKD